MSIDFRVIKDRIAGDFASDTAAPPPAAAPVPTLTAALRVLDSEFPDPSAVTFIAPQGALLRASDGRLLREVAADAVLSRRSPSGRDFTYVTPPQRSVQAGTWTVRYKGILRPFVAAESLQPFQGDLSFSLTPQATLDTTGHVVRLDWRYASATGAPIAAPVFIRDLQVTLESDESDAPVVSPSFDRSVTSFTLPASIEWARVRNVEFRFTHSVTRAEQRLEFAKSGNMDAEVRRENVYSSLSPGGQDRRLLAVTINAGRDAVETGVCAATVQNEGASGPFPTTTCVDNAEVRSGGDGTTSLVLDLARQLDDPLPIGTPFRFAVTPAVGLPVSLVSSVTNPDTSEIISIPNPSTPGVKPSGFTLADAKLGQDQSISWTLPTFQVEAVSLWPVVNGVDGQACGDPQDLPVTAISATFRFRTNCEARPITSAKVCVLIRGTDGAVSSACWSFEPSVPMVAFTDAVYGVIVSDGTARITVTRDAADLAAATSVRYETTTAGTAKAGSDYQPTAGTLEFAEGQRTASFTIDVLGGTASGTTVGVRLFDVTGGTLGRDTALLTIGTATVEFPLATYSVPEGAVGVFTVRRSGPATGALAVSYSMSDDTATSSDYIRRSGTLTFPSGVIVQTIAVVILQNQIHTGNRAFFVTLNPVAGGAVIGRRLWRASSSATTTRTPEKA
jgi:hypothetical protein